MAWTLHLDQASQACLDRLTSAISLHTQTISQTGKNLMAEIEDLEGVAKVVAAGSIYAAGWGLDETTYPNYFINTNAANRLTLQAGTSITLTGYKFNLPNGTLELLAGTTITQTGRRRGGQFTPTH